MRDGNKPTFVAVDVPDDGNLEEKVVGFAQWELPSPSAAPEAEPSEADKDPLPASLDQDALRAIIDIIETETKKALGPDGHSKVCCM